MERPGRKSIPLGGESSSSMGKDYEVFLSFRGPDTRLTITDSLYASMIRAGIRVFKDDEELRVGEEIGDELLRAISNSKIYIPIFSKGYASSRWCLRELAYMVEDRKRYQKAILPIFYEVDASDLKLRTGSYGNALRKHERQSGENLAKQWEEALREVAEIKGWNLKDHGQDKLIALVLEEVLDKLRPSQRNWHNDLVGIHHHMEAVMDLLGQGTSGVRFVVIHGMGGIGKTTLAKAIFKSISSQFQSSSFLPDIRADNITSLQKKLLHDVADIRDSDLLDVIIRDDDRAMYMIKKSLGDKKVILVLDDMDKTDQLKKLAQKSCWFGSGSRIIITTRNTYFLAPKTDTLDDNVIPENHRDFFFYEMKEMQFRHALQLFSRHSSPPLDCSSISSEIVKITGGLPLALEVIGSFLHSKNKIIWKDTLKKLKKVPNQDVQKKLLISYEELEYEERQIFLDIACHCIGEERIPAYYMWKAKDCDFFPKIGLRVLIHLSLIKITEDDRFWMHDQLRDLGREIVRQECIQDPGKRSRLWCPTVALDVIQNNLGTYNIVALKLPKLADWHNFTSDKFSRLPSLRFLELDGGNFVGDFKNLLSNLKWLSWRRCPSNLHATGLCLRKLAVLKISESDITEDWNGWESCTVSDNLKVVYLTRCNRLKRTPDFSKCLNMKRLVIQYCSSLAEINSSIGRLGRLKYLEVNKVLGATKTQGFFGFDSFAPPLLPASIGGLKSLSTLKVEYRDDVRELPHSIGELLGLKHLSLRNCCKLEKLPDSIGELRSLLCLDLFETGISGLPESIGRLESLLDMNLSCTSIAKLPNSIGNLGRLQFLRLNRTKIRELPKSIWALENLEELIAEGCYNLEGKILSEIAGLSQLKILNLSWSKVSGLPTTLNCLCSLRELVLSGCNCLQLLPDLPTSLTKLELSSPSLQAVPNLSNHTSLLHLDISDCDWDLTLSKTIHGRISNPNLEWLGRLHELQTLRLANPNLEWLGRLHELQTLRLVLSDSNLPPTDFSSLSRLRSLEITCLDPRSLIRLPSSLEKLVLKDVRTPIEWPMLSNLGNLSELNLYGCRLREIEFDDALGRLENLRRLEVHKCKSLERLSNLLSLKELRELSVHQCPQLIEIEPRPSSAGDCGSMEWLISETPKLEKLQFLIVYFCKSLRKLPDVPDACRAHVNGCPFLRN